MNCQSWEVELRTTEAERVTHKEFPHSWDKCPVLCCHVIIIPARAAATVQRMALKKVLFTLMRCRRFKIAPKAQ